MILSDDVKNKLLAIESELIEHEFPPQLVIENTSHCDQQCIHCSHKEMKRTKRHMSREVWNKIVEEVGREAPNTEIWPTFYGEALILGQELWDRIDYAAEVGCTNLVLNSNGGLLHRKDHITRVLNSPLKRFILSLDGFSKATYEKIRVWGQREQVYANVEELLRRKEESGQVYPAIICQFSVMEENEHELEDFIKYWKARGAEVKARPKLEWASVGTIKSDRIDHDTDFRIACPWGNNTMAIHQDGSVVACAIDYEGKVNVGNVADVSVKELWKNLGVELRRSHREHKWDEIPDICKNCRDWQTSGASYEEETTPDTRPFWFKPNQTDTLSEKQKPIWLASKAE